MKYSRKNILKFMAESAKRPMSFKELSTRLKVPKDDRDHFKAIIKDMASDGVIVRIRGGRYGVPSKMNLVSGTLECHPDGFGFVIPEGDGNDVFINRSRIKDAMHGDRVVARVEGVKREGKREGRIIRVLERANKSVVGRLEHAGSGAFVIASDERILQEIIIAPEKTLDAPEGSLVVAEITRWPTKRIGAAGEVTEVLGDPEDPDVEIELITRKYGLPLRFPKSVAKEADKVPDKVSSAETNGRTDLRTKRLVTIDGETAKDFDDAVGIERASKGYKLYVAIADVSYYVAEGGILDEEAYQRGTSVYFPDRCVPMLPEALSNGICSLNPKVERLALTAELDFDARGELKKKRFYESVIKSTERLTYKKVKAILEGEDDSLAKEYSHVAGDLKIMEELARKLMKRRFEAGSIDFDLPEPQIIIDIEGQVEDIVKSERNIAHRIIEEFMLSANRAVASVFADKEYPFIYRVHEEPDEESIAEFKEFVGTFGYAMRGKGPKAFQRVLSAFDSRPEEKLVNQVLLRCMKQAVYSDDNCGHFGLAFTDYTHFTSPIRRYPDLVVHRLLKKVLKRKYTAKERERAGSMLGAVALHSSKRERNAMEAEREIADLKKAQFMEDKVGEEFDGVISGVTSFGVFVELKEYLVEGLVHVTTLTDDYYNFAEKEHSLVGEGTKKRYRLGSEVRVRISSVDIGRRRIEMVLASSGDDTSAGYKRGRKPRKGRRRRQRK